MVFNKKERISLRESNTNLFSNQFENVIDYYSNDNLGSLISSVLLLFLLILFLTLLTLGLIVILVMFFLGKFVLEEKDVNKRIFLSIGIALSLILLILLIISIVFVAISVDSGGKSLCQTNRIANNLINGSQERPFIGLSGMEKIYGFLENEIE